MRILAILAALMLGVPATAHADWQNTSWGMTPEQVKTAVPGARDATPDEQRKHGPSDSVASLVVAPYGSGALQMKAYFNFSAGLSLVTLDLDQPENCDDLLTTLKLRYGNPLSEQIRNGVGTAIWLTKVDQVSLAWLGPQWGSVICSIRYQPLQNPVQKAFNADPGRSQMKRLVGR